MALFIGMAPLSLLIAAYGGIFVGNRPGKLMMLAGLINVIGCFGVTVCFNALMHEALAGMNVADSTTQDYWNGTYLPRWTSWNTVRTIASAASDALLLFSLMWMIQSQAA